MKFAAICVIETKSDELFIDNDDPVFVKISVTYDKMSNVPDAQFSTSNMNETKMARLACGVTK